MIFAEDPGAWGSPLREGRVRPEQLELLKARLADSGLFDLEGTCYLVPDAPVDCVVVSFDGQEQMLYWDERENPGYGINARLEQRHLEFIAAWKLVNAAALAARPAESTPLAGEFGVPPAWSLRPPVQSR